MSRSLLLSASKAFKTLNLSSVRGGICSQNSFFSSTSQASSSQVESQAPEVYAETLEETRARIFGNLLGDGSRSGAKLLRKKLVGEKIASYYSDDIARRDPMLIDTKAEAKKLKLEKLKRRGKGPPPKGQGKRATKGKKK